MNYLELEDLIDKQITSLPGWCTPDKAKRIMRVAATMATAGDVRAVELGVYGGRSLVALALGFKYAGRGRIDGVDSWSREDCLEGDQSPVDRKLWGQDTDYEALIRHTRDGLERFGVADIATLVRKRNDDAVADYADGSIDLLHLDGNHSELVSVRDVGNWLPKMAPKSTWIADDTNWPSIQRALGMLQAGGFKLVEQGSEGYWSVYARG